MQAEQVPDVYEIMREAMRGREIVFTIKAEAEETELQSLTVTHVTPPTSFQSGTATLTFHVPRHLSLRRDVIPSQVQIRHGPIIYKTRRPSSNFASSLSLSPQPNHPLHLTQTHHHRTLIPT
jgi:hypothetical protein